MSEVQKESYVDEARRRIAHLSHKLEEAEKKIKSLEYDNAELVRWTNDTCVPKLQELTDELVTKYNQKKYPTHSHHRREYFNECGNYYNSKSDVKRYVGLIGRYSKMNYDI